MREELLEYYERELTYLRQMGGEFARKYPKVAGRLLLDPDRCDDPHVSRLLEGFAFLAARVHRRIDDDFPEISESLTRIIHPGYLRPIPSMTIVECQPDPAQGKKTAGMRIPRGTPLVTKATVEGLPCRFLTAYDVDLWPFSVTAAEWRQPERMQRPPRASVGVQAAAAARLRLRCQRDVVFSGLPLSRLRFHLAGDASVVYSLYELLSEKCIEIQLRDPKDEKKLISLEPARLRMVGFDAEESLLPFVRRSMDGHRLLQEYFALPEKFLFFDLEGLEPLAQASFGDEAEIVFLFSSFERAERQQVLELGVNERTFRLGCTPAINLFPQSAEPILLSQTRHDYTVVPDNRHSALMEIFSIEEVIATNPRLRQSVVLEPMHAYRYQTRNREDIAFWVATRHLNEFGEREPSTMTISVVDLTGNFTEPEADVLMVRTLCSNFDLPSRFQFGSEVGDFDATGYAAAKTVTALRRPTASINPSGGQGHLWRLISLLSLNYLSLNEEGRTAMQEILRLHNLTDSAASENQVGSILRMNSSPGFALVDSAYGLIPARGTQVEMEFDEQQFAGSGLYLFAAVLDRFLAGYASMNSFSQLTARSTLRKEAMGKWPPRAGTQALL
ncbi:MAG TPA: type VI secretion system baseplate subunit TssF [Terracidiphilus sp.]|nr:type VI secretion system baseplate subunit TssF [Terracidiphilus sp.]